MIAQHPQAWIPSKPNLQPGFSRAKELAGKTTALRSVEAGPLFFECWVEEGDAGVRSSLSSQETSQSQRSQGMPLA